MKFCPQCGTQLDDTAVVCSNCGANLGMPVQPVAAPAVNVFDHTAEFDPKDISENKVFAMAVYLLGFIGIIIALLACKESKYAGFHARQSLKLNLVSVLLGICAVLLCWTIIVPIAAGVCAVIVVVLQIICFFNVCNGKAKEPAIIRSLGFLK